MLFEDSFEKIKDNFLRLEENKKNERKMNIVELLFIVFSILIMIPYEIVSSYEWMKIYGGLNLFCDIVFVILLYRLWKQYKNKEASSFVVTTDLLAALPGIAAIFVALISLTITKDFHLGEFIAAGGLALQALKTTKFLRILRVTRLFRIIRNIKVLKFISMKSDSTSCENAVGWIGFVLLIFLIISNFSFMFFGPVALMEDDYNNRIELLHSELELQENITKEIIINTAMKYGLNDQILLIKEEVQHITDEENIEQSSDTIKTYYEEFQPIEVPDKIAAAARKFETYYSGLNSTFFDVQGYTVFIDDGEVFEKVKRNNLLWILVIIYC